MARGHYLVITRAAITQAPITDKVLRNWAVLMDLVVRGTGHATLTSAITLALHADARLGESRNLAKFDQFRWLPAFFAFRQSGHHLLLAWGNW